MNLLNFRPFFISFFHLGDFSQLIVPLSRWYNSIFSDEQPSTKILVNSIFSFYLFCDCRCLILFGGNNKCCYYFSIAWKKNLI